MQYLLVGAIIFARTYHNILQTCIIRNKESARQAVKMNGGHSQLAISKVISNSTYLLSFESNMLLSLNGELAIFGFEVCRVHENGAGSTPRIRRPERIRQLRFEGDEACKFERSGSWKSTGA